MNTKKTFITIILILVFAAIAAWFAYSYLTSQKVEIYTFNDNYKAGTKIEASMLSGMPMDVNLVNQVNNSENDSKYILYEEANQMINNGEFLKYNVYKGMPLLAESTISYGGNAVETRLTADMVAVTIAVDNVTGVTPELSHDSRVNLIVSYQKDETLYTDMFMENLRVIDVQASVEDDLGNKQLLALTVEATPENALKIKNAANYAMIDFGLVKTGQYKENEELPAYTNQDFITNADKKRAEREELLAETEEIEN